MSNVLMMLSGYTNIIVNGIDVKFIIVNGVEIN